jgi:Tol biopolymer transport system component
MELVEGDMLAQRIQRGPIPADEALTYARQIAEALEAAHEKGVIHRDLKPANVKITPEGKAKVLDFGLAKALDPTPGTGALGVTNSPTLSIAATHAGVILGTAAYMSPEQAKGVATDQRSDIFSFGCVLYEMLTGRQPFQGDTITEVIASVLKTEADLALLPSQLNPKVVELIRRGLAKDPKRRWHAAADVRMELEAILADPQGLTVRAEPAVRHQPLWRRAIPFAATAAGAAAIAAAVAWNVRPAPAVPIARFTHVLPDDQLLTRTGRHNIAVSPDGRNIVYVADNQLYLRGIGDLEARPIAGTNQDVNTPFFSPDGQWIGFYVGPEAKLKKIAITGGASVTIADATNPYGASWEASDRIVIGQGEQGIVRVSANGGTPEPIVKVETGQIAHGPQMLPNGDHVLFTVAQGTGATRWDEAQIVVQSLQSGERTVVINGGSDARYVTTGHIVYGLESNLLAVPFDERSLTVTGGPVPIVEGVGRSAAANTAAMFFSFSSNGALAYLAGTGNVQVNRSLARVDRKGAAAALPMPPLSYWEPRISPDGRQLAVRVDAENELNIWIHDLAGAVAPRRLTFGGANFSPAWTPDGRRIVFLSTRDDNLSAIFWQSADGSGSAERLTDPKAAQPTSYVRVSSDGRIVYRDARSDGDVWMLPLEGDRKLQPAIEGPGNQFEASLSPDGRWMVYTSSESGRAEVYVQPFPPTGAKYQITTTEGHDPLWSTDGRQIFYLAEGVGNNHRLVSVDVRTDSGFAVANPTRLFEEVWDTGGGWPYDVTPDGQFVVLTRPTDAGPEAASNPEIRVTLNWFEELRQRVPRGSR